ncbi:hypothetical protein DFH07DRAFT_843385 [Mycena maculata]|uniref:Macrofage activating glycoprotein n=1 Tax=Mycena maculata TaxID=230809 RepID=A0AAD7I5S9_9AGAR|nr:hypothetical protein DFH07DRAFT_843385 [Mycena maculata]
MSGSTLLVSLLALSTVVRADYFSTDPLVDKVVPYDQIPYQVMTDTDDPRGFQSGYNQCNSSTENQDSLCQTMFVNHLDDFCLWAPATPNTTISDAEANVVAWCSKAGHGTRIIPNGAITGIQLVQTPSYIQIAGTLNQLMLDVGGTDGGELDSGGQDGEGNPMGGLVYSNAFPSNNGNNASYQQAQHWSFFIGDGAFCGKICDQTGSNPQGLCNNIYDRLGCDYNAPNDAAAGMFEACAGDDMIPVGTYVVNGATSVYTQPAETVPIDYNALPYTPTPAPSSNCVSFASADLFAAGASITGAGSASATGVSGSQTGAATTGATGGAAAKSGSGTATASGSTASTTGSSGAPAALGVSVGAMALAFGAVLLV